MDESMIEIDMKKMGVCALIFLACILLVAAWSGAPAHGATTQSTSQSTAAPMPAGAFNLAGNPGWIWADDATGKPLDFEFTQDGGVLDSRFEPNYFGCDFHGSTYLSPAYATLSNAGLSLKTSAPTVAGYNCTGAFVTSKSALISPPTSATGAIWVEAAITRTGNAPYLDAGMIWLKGYINASDQSDKQELDIAEQETSSTGMPYAEHQTFWLTNAAGTFYQVADSAGALTATSTINTAQTHVYAAYIAKNYVIYYVDGKMTGGAYYSAAPTEPLYILMSNESDGPPSAAMTGTSTVTLEYLRVYEHL